MWLHNALFPPSGGNAYEHERNKAQHYTTNLAKKKLSQETKQSNEKHYNNHQWGRVKEVRKCEWPMGKEKKTTKANKTLTAKKISSDRYCVDDQFDLFVTQLLIRIKSLL